MNIEFWHQKAKRELKKVMSQDEAAALLGMKKTTFNHKINGVRPCDDKEMMFIAGLIGVSVDELCIDDPNYSGNRDDVRILQQLKSVSARDKEVFASMLEQMI